MQMPQQGQTRATPILRLTACCNMRQTTCCAFAQGCAAGGAARTKDGGRRMSYRHRHPYPFQTFRHEIHLECRGCRVRWFGFSRHLHTFVADRTKDVAPCMQIQFGWLVSNYSGSGFWELGSGIWHPASASTSCLWPLVIPPCETIRRWFGVPCVAFS